MLFMSIFTYEPAMRDKVLERRAEGLFTPEGARCLGQWSDVSGGRAVTLYDVDDAATGYKWAHAWSDLGKFDVFPVIDTEELFKMMGKK